MTPMARGNCRPDGEVRSLGQLAGYVATQIAAVFGVE